MAYYVVEGGNRGKGVYVPQGAKNEALQVISAALLCDGEVTYHNVPEIGDVLKMLKILEALGSEIKKISHGSYRIRAKNINPDNLLEPEIVKIFRELRGSILVIGPLLARFGKVSFPAPGGDKIGRRSIDTHLNSFLQLGVKLKYDDKKNTFTLEGTIHGENYILMDEPSVTGTANLLLALALNPHKVTIYNCACEPYIQQTSRLLQKMGVEIEGAGTNLIRIKGTTTPSGATHTLLSDMIEVGSIIGLAVATSSEITIKNAGVNHLGSILPNFKKIGINVITIGDDIYVPPHENFTISERIDGGLLTIYDAPWPGFPADLISIVITVAIHGRGSLLVHQKMFESRLFFVDRLIEMGAKIILCDPHRVVVIGLDRQVPLRGITMSSPDIRAGMALLIAALSAHGTSIIHNIEQIQRGYENIHQKLANLGFNIQLVD